MQRVRASRSGPPVIALFLGRSVTRGGRSLPYQVSPCREPRSSHVLGPRGAIRALHVGIRVLEVSPEGWGNEAAPLWQFRVNQIVTGHSPTYPRSNCIPGLLLGGRDDRIERKPVVVC